MHCNTKAIIEVKSIMNVLIIVRMNDFHSEKYASQFAGN